MSLAPAALAAYLSMCAPTVSADTMRAIVAVESGGNPLAIGDNTTRRSYAPRDLTQAKSIAHALLAQHHSLDIGLGQINSGNFSGNHVTADAMFEPCANLGIASKILANAYQQAIRVSPTPEAALWGAISAYNTGSIRAGAPYVAAVVRQAQRSTIVPTISLLTGAQAPRGKVEHPPVMPIDRSQRPAAVHVDMDTKAATAPLKVDAHSGINHTLEVINHGA